MFTKVLLEEVGQVRSISHKWETQVQDSLVTIERLKGLLEESATWSAQGAGNDAVGSSSHGSSTNADAAANGNADEMNSTDGLANGETHAAVNAERVHAALLIEQARAADLDLQVRALCAELTRAHMAHKDVGRSMLPVLNAVESRLMGLRTAAVRQR